MGAIAGVTASSVGTRQKLVTDKFKQIQMTITLGDGTSTYPSGGVPVTASALGLRSFIRNIIFFDESNADGFVYKFDSTNSKIRIYQGNYGGSVAAALVELTTAATPQATFVAEVEGV